MRRFTAKLRQKMVDDYLADTGESSIEPAALLAWLEVRPTHPAFLRLFGDDDAHHAKQNRLNILRGILSSIRTVVVATTTPGVVAANTVVVATYQKGESPAHVSFPDGVRRTGSIRIPSLISVRSERNNRGGYVPLNLSDPKLVCEFAGQAADALVQWIERYGGFVEFTGSDLDAVRGTFDALRAIETPEDEI